MILKSDKEVHGNKQMTHRLSGALTLNRQVPHLILVREYRVQEREGS